MICPTCNTENPATALYCVSCGTALGAALPSSQSSESLPPYQPGEILAATYQAAKAPTSNYQQPHPGKELSAMNQAENKLSKAGKIMGIVVGCVTLVGLIPCLGWLNWFNLIFGGITNILCWVGIFTEGKENPQAKMDAVLGLIISFVALMVGSVRLLLGAGCV